VAPSDKVAGPGANPYGELLVLTPEGSPGEVPVTVTVAGETSTVTLASTSTYTFD